MLFFGCTKKNNANKIQNENKKPTIVTTIFPIYDWVKNIAGESVNIEGLFKNGADLHNYQPTVQDIVKISNCDLFIYVGGESDGWVSDALKTSTNQNRIVINLLEAIGEKLKEEEIVEGMQFKKENYDNDEDDVEYDEHVWLSLQNAKILCSSIKDALCTLDDENKTAYEKNYEEYCKKLIDLDNQYKTVVCSASKNAILVADRFPFRYLVDDYNLYYFAAFLGCSAETEASFKTIKFLSDKIDELKLNYIFTIENSDSKIAKTVIENSKSKNQKILVLDSMQSVSIKDIKNGANYIAIMQKNLQELKTALE